MDQHLPSNPPDSSVCPIGLPGPRETALAREPNRFRRLLKILGPGLISGASDDDPASVGTCASVGASLGYVTLWLTLYAIPLMIAVQYISAKVGQVTGQGLAGVLRRHYSRLLLYPVTFGLVITSSINAGADLGAVADGVNLLVPALPSGYLIGPIALLILVLQIWGSYRLIEKIFKWLVLSLLAYLGAGFLARPNVAEVLWCSLVPQVRWDRAYLEATVAILGSAFAPYLYFWQSTQEVEGKLALGRRKLWQRRGTTDAELTYAAWDVGLGMSASNLVTYFIILTTAATLFQAGQHEIPSARVAAEALRPLVGEAAGVLFAIGMIGAGVLAVPVLTTAGAYALSEAFGWRFGLDQKPYRAPQFYTVIVLSTAAGVGLNYLGINPIQALYLTSVIYGFLAPPLLLLLMLVSRKRAIMGHQVNGQTVEVLGWISTAATFAAAAGLVLTWI